MRAIDWWRDEILTQFWYNLGDVVDWGEQATVVENEAEKGLTMCDKSIYSTNNTYHAPDI
jgi:hypothetical protein